MGFPLVRCRLMSRRDTYRNGSNEESFHRGRAAMRKARLGAWQQRDLPDAQAWHFIVVQGRGLLARLDAAAKEAARQTDIGHLRQLGNDDEFHCLYGPPTLIIVSGDQGSPVPLEADCAAATENLLIAAESLVLGSCWGAATQ